MSISGLLNVSKLGIFANQAALKVTGHNISNVNTPGYVRQSATMMASPNSANTLSGGEGVFVDEVKRQVDGMVERRVGIGQQELGRLNARSRFIPLIENVFNDMDGEGLAKRMEALFTAADGVADNPTNPVGRAQLLVEGDSLSKTVNQMYTNLSEVSLPVDQEITYMVSDINNRLKALSTIDLAIVHQESTPSPALDLKDQRQQMVKDLSNLIDVQTFNNQDGSVTVMTLSGKLLVDHDYYATLSRGGTDPTSTGFQGIRINNRMVDITGEIQNGELKGLIEVRDQIVHGTSGWLTKLESFVDELRYRVNVVHSQSVGKSMPTSFTSAYAMGSQLNTAMSGLTNADAPPDATRVSNGAITFAFGATDAAITTESVTINSTDTINQVVTAINSSTNIAASLNSDNKLVLTPKNGNKVMAVVEDTSAALAALGINVFFAGFGPRDMKVDPQLQANHDLVAAARIVNKNGAYSFDNVNNAGAIAFGNMRSERFTFKGESDSNSFSGKYAGITGDLGSVSKSNTESHTAQQAAQAFVEDVREGVSGVSLEEELTNMMKFQRAFQASSKMVSIADELMNTLLSMVR